MDEVLATILIVPTPIYLIIKKFKTNHMEKVILKEQYLTAKRQKEEREKIISRD